MTANRRKLGDAQLDGIDPQLHLGDLVDAQVDLGERIDRQMDRRLASLVPVAMRHVGRENICPHIQAALERAEVLYKGRQKMSDEEITVSSNKSRLVR